MLVIECICPINFLCINNLISKIFTHCHVWALDARVYKTLTEIFKFKLKKYPN